MKLDQAIQASALIGPIQKLQASVTAIEGALGAGVAFSGIHAWTNLGELGIEFPFNEPDTATILNAVLASLKVSLSNLESELDVI